MEILNSIAASTGLTPLGSLGPLLVGVALLWLVVKLLSMPFKLVWNGLCGALLLWVLNLFGAMVGMTIKITVINALIAGFFGIPGALAVLAYNILVK